MTPALKTKKRSLPTPATGGTERKTEEISPSKRMRNTRGRAKKKSNVASKKEKTVIVKKVPFQLLAKDDPAVQSQDEHVKALSTASSQIKSNFYVSQWHPLAETVEIKLKRSGKPALATIAAAVASASP